MKEETVALTVNDKEVEIDKGASVLQAVQKLGIFIPTLCYHELMEPEGACRLCLVEVEFNGIRRVIASCAHPATEGLKVFTDTENVIENRTIVAELLLARCSENKQVKELCAKMGVTETPFTKKKEDCVLCGQCVRICHSKMKIGAINYIGRGGKRKVGAPFDEYSEMCITCGACEMICPTGAITAKMSSGKEPIRLGKEFEENLNTRGNIDIPFPSAVPLVPRLHKDNCIHFQIGNEACKMCQSACPADAIDFSQTSEETKLDVGAVIIAPGFESFDPTGIEYYAYNAQPNVLTAMEFERMLSAGGPFAGHVHRLSDGREPKKMAWLQCVGSRNVSEHSNAYCSSVCCMYALKQALIAKDHVGQDLDAAIFFIDLRTYDKEFERYRERVNNAGVRLIRSSIRTIDPEWNNGDLKIRYATESGKLEEETFDMVVLSTGLKTSKNAIALAETLGIRLGDNQFTDTSCFKPVSTTKPGIYACGAITYPKTISQTVMEASAAATASISYLAEVRDTLTKKKEFPPEKDISNDLARVGVFICNCGINIGGIADVPAIVDYAKTLPNVEHAQENIFSCTQDSLNQMAEKIKANNLNRVVVAACTPSTHEPIFQTMLNNAGLNKYLFEMANIRNQCTWCHQNEPGMATEKCKDLVNMAVAKARLLEPLKFIKVGVEKVALIIGGGASGMTSSVTLANQGFKVHLVEVSKQLGGNALKLHTSWRGEKIQPFVDSLIEEVNGHENIMVHLDSTIKEVSGYIGNFKSTFSNGQEIDHGVVIFATGAQAHKPDGQFLYNEHPNVLLSLELDSEIAQISDRIKAAKAAAFIQCVGSRIPERPYCSKICCSHSVENAIKLKEINPKMDVYILYRDIKTYGERELLYRKAREMGVVFIRYDVNEPPVTENAQDRIRIKVKDQVLRLPVEIEVDILTLASAIIPNNNAELSQLYKVALNTDGFFAEAHAKIRPVECPTDGIFIAGQCHYPKPLEECIAESMASASRAMTILSKDHLEMDAMISHPIDENCDGCAFCIDICPYRAITLLDFMKEGDVKKTVEINEALCKGCGSCMATCPKRGIHVLGFTTDQLSAQVEAALGII